ncbi:MAG: hypothetical protein NTW25_07630 [Candidatus Kapabacteria bacterium]|nr:hypothetical protein [Candidatus Kapabacteria bacterium]
MKKLVLAFLILTSVAISSQNLPFKMERLNTDFKGVIYFNNTIFAYGDYGVILSTKDFGKNWKQNDIDEDSDIKNIIEINGRLIGIAGSNIIEYDNIRDVWNKYFIKDSIMYKDIAYANSQIFLISDNKIKSFDLNFNLIIEDFIKDNSKFKAIETKDNELNILTTNLKLIKYDTQNNFIKDSINLNSKINFISTDNLEFKIIDNDYYLGLISGLHKSIDGGFNWNKIDTIYNTFEVKNKIIYEISSLNNLKTPSEINFNKFEQNVKKNINQNYKNKDSTRLVFSYDFKGFIFISNDTIVSVGADKLIAMSIDGGKDWEVISYFNTYYAQHGNQLHIVNDSLIFALNRNFCINKSTNGGLTWLPQYFKYRNSSDYKIFNANYNNNWGENNTYFDNKGNGICVLTSRDYIQGQDSINFMRTFDFGNTYEYGYNKGLDIGDGLIGANFVKFDSNLILLSSDYNRFAPSYQNTNYIRLSKFDNKLNFIENIKINYQKILKIISDESQNSFFLIKDSTGINLCEYTSGIDTFRILYSKLNFLENQQIKRIRLLNNNKRKYLLYFTDSTSGGEVFDVQSGKFIITKRTVIDTLFFYNLDTKETIVSYVTTDTNSHLRNSIYGESFFKIDDSCFLSTSDGIIFNDNIFIDCKNWEEINVSTYSFWGILKGNKYIFCVNSNKDFSERKYGGVFRLSFLESKSSIETIEDQTYFYSYPPYPLPARNELKSLIYWDMSYNIDDSDIGVYDIYGNKIANREKISINKLNSYSGYLSWDCTGVGTGVYIIQIKHGTNTHNIRAMVVR